MSGQETCCLDIGFRHVSSASGCVSSGARHVTFGQTKGNQRTNGPVNAHLICLPSKAQDIQNMENLW